MKSSSIMPTPAALRRQRRTRCAAFLGPGVTATRQAMEAVSGIERGFFRRRGLVILMLRELTAPLNPIFAQPQFSTDNAMGVAVLAKRLTEG